MNDSPMNKYFLFLIFIIFSCQPNKQIEEVSISYPDAQKPEDVPLVFGEGTISVKGRFDLGITISSDGKSLVFGVADPDATLLYLMNFQQGKWSEPDKSFLEENENIFFPMFSPSDNELFYAKSVEGYETDIWKASFDGAKANDPQPLDSLINSTSREAGHGMAMNGSFYFTSNRDDQYQCCGDIFYTAPESSEVKKSEILNSGSDEESLFLSPNDNFIIIQSWRQEYQSKHDLYISYRTKDGSWTAPDRLNEKINSPEIEQRPFISPDNQFLFFSRMSITRENDEDIFESDIYWVSTKEVFKPYPFDTLTDTYVPYNETFQLNFPSDLFKDLDDDKLSYQVTLEDGSSLSSSNVIHEGKLEPSYQVTLEDGSSLPSWNI